MKPRKNTERPLDFFGGMNHYLNDQQMLPDWVLMIFDMDEFSSFTV